MYSKLIKLWIRKSYDAMNGKINKIPSISYTFNYDPEANKLGGEHNGNITFYPQCIQRIFSKLRNESQFRAMCVITVAHELSHVDQAIDYDRYASDIEYAKSIENDNNKRAFTWLLTNLNYVNSIMSNIDIEFIINQAKRYNVDVNGYYYTNLSLYETIRTQIESLINIRVRFDDLMNIKLRIIKENSSFDFIIKSNGLIGNAEQIMYALKEIYKYTQYSLCNTIENDSLIILVQLNEDDLYITKHMHHYNAAYTN